MVSQCATVNMLAPVNIISIEIVATLTSCIEPCDVNVTVKWQNTGDITGQFTPGIIVDSGAATTLPLESLDGGNIVTHSFTVLNLMGGIHTIQAYPNAGTAPQMIDVIARGSASFSSNPSGAKIFVDDADTGLTTPNTVTNLTPGPHTYKLTLTGYYDTTGGFDVVSGQTTTVPTVTIELIVGTLSISSTPPGASIYIDNSQTPSGTTPAILTLAEGTRTFRLTLAGYYDETGTANVVRNQITTLTIGLTQATGDVYITSSPAGAKIFVDNIDQGIVTPNVVTHLTVETHTYKLTLEGYLDSTGTFDIVQDQLTRLSVTMVILPGNLSIESIPHGAKIFINGVDQSVVTPNTIQNLAPGTYDVKLTLTDYAELITTVTIATNHTTILDLILTPLPGSLAISSTPPGAKIFINGVDQSVVTPNTISNLTPGTYGIRLALANYYDFTESVTIEPNRPAGISGTLYPMPGTLIINSTPSGAQVFINGILQTGVTPTTITGLSPGTPTIVLTYLNYYDLPKLVIIGPNETITLNEILNPKPGTLIITTTPPDAKIFMAATGEPLIDTTIVTPNPVTNLTPGTYDVKLTLANYQDLIINGVVIGPNEDVTRTDILIPLPGNLEISSTPSGAEIWLAPSGQALVDQGNVTPDTIQNLTPETYDLKLVLANYNDYTATTSISPNQGTMLTVDLVPLPGFLDITSTPSGAEIWLAPSGQALVDQGVTTHGTISNLVPGTYDIKLALTNYYDYITTKTIGPHQGIYLDIVLNPMPGSLTITSTPTGAQVFINGTLQIGATPTTIQDLEVGTYTVKLTHAEYQDLTTDIVIGPNESVILDRTLILLPGSLLISSTPPGASVYIDNSVTPSGVTPGAFALSEGAHSYKLTLPRYYDVTDTFNIIHMQTTTRSISMTEATGDVFISSSPSGALIHIDGTLLPGMTTPTTMTRIPVGTHPYRLTLTGYEDATGTFDIIPNQLTIVPTVTLTRSVVATGFGSAGMLMVTGLAVGVVLTAGRPKMKPE